MIIAVYVSRRASLPPMNERKETTQTVDCQDDSVESRMRESDRELVRLRKTSHEAEREVAKAVS